MENNDFREIFESDGVFVELQKQRHESREMFMDRVHCVLSKIKESMKQDNDDVDIATLEKQSKIWLNQRILGCEY